jgi:hypothetical protein
VIYRVHITWYVHTYSKRVARKATGLSQTKGNSVACEGHCALSTTDTLHTLKHTISLCLQIHKRGGVYYSNCGHPIPTNTHSASTSVALPLSFSSSLSSSIIMTAAPHPYDLPSEECVILLCSYIQSLLVAAQRAASSPKLVSTPPCSPSGTTLEENQSRNPHPSPRRSLDYVAERPNGAITHVLGDEYSIGVGFDEVDLQRQRDRIALRFSSKSVPKISLLDYLERCVPREK